MKYLSQKIVLACFCAIGIVVACSNAKKEPITSLDEPSKKENNIPAQPTSEAFNTYWYAGKAEITSYKLEQARYGEIHQGNAVLVYVTEDFNPERQVKANTPKESNVSILKLNATKKFFTGIYPYSVMTSTFFPVKNNQHATKITTSIQEWCGHVYMQLNNREQFEVQSFSYFESEADQEFALSKTVLEDELWTQIRVNPESLPTGTLQMIPSFEMIRMRHIPAQTYLAELTIATTENDTSMYTISYPDLYRKLVIEFATTFPHDIIGWTETTQNGYGISAKTMTTKATRMQQLKTAYWSQNNLKDSVFRKKLGL